MRYSKLALLAMIVCVVVALAGCGGGGGGTVAPTGSGSLGFRVVWPERPAGVYPQLIPAYSESIKLEVFIGDKTVASKTAVINRPQTSVRIDGVEATAVVLRATACPQADGVGVPQAAAQIAVTVPADKYTEWPLTLKSTITHIVISPDPTNVEIGQTKQLIVTAKNASEQTVLVPATNPFTFSLVSGGTFISVDAAGKATGKATGEAVVRVVENESSVASNVAVNCGTYVAADLATALAVPLPTNPVPGSLANIENLSRLQTQSNQPRDPTKLRAELSRWVAAAKANPNDTAAQTGLAFSIIAVASYDGGKYVGKDLFQEFNIQNVTAAAFSNSLRVEQFVNDALNATSLKAVPQIRGASATVSTASAPAVSELDNYRTAVREFLAKAIANAQARFAAIADLANPATLLISLTSTNSGEIYHVYAADYQALTAAMQFIRSGLLMVSSFNPDYGNYDWTLDIKDRDANRDGKLTVAEYTPSAPFGDIDTATWSEAGDTLAAAVDRLSLAIQKRQTADSRQLVNLALQDQNLTEVQNYISDAHKLLAGQVNVTVHCRNRGTTSGQWIDKGDVLIPLNLRALWKNAQSSIKSWLPPLYLFLDTSWWGSESYTSGDGMTLAAVSRPTGDIRAYDLLQGLRSYHVSISGPTASWEGDVSLPIAAAPHQCQIPATGSFPGGTVSVNADWSAISVTANGVTTTLNWSSGAGSAPSIETLTKWNDIPDRTFSGLFPDPNKMRSLYEAGYDKLSFQFGSINIGEGANLPVYVSQK